MTYLTLFEICLALALPRSQWPRHHSRTACASWYIKELLAATTSLFALRISVCTTHRALCGTARNTMRAKRESLLRTQRPTFCAPC